MRAIDTVVDVVAVVITSALVVLVAANHVGPVRLFFALGFVTFVPGWALLDHVPLVEGSRKAALAVAASFTICAIGALTLLWLRTWRPFVVFHVIAITSLVALTASIARTQRLSR